MLFPAIHLLRSVANHLDMVRPEPISQDERNPTVLRNVRFKTSIPIWMFEGSWLVWHLPAGFSAHLNLV
jgi:hypothetical protein